jgi:hypothetical protein
VHVGIALKVPDAKLTVYFPALCLVTLVTAGVDVKIVQGDDVQVGLTVTLSTLSTPSLLVVTACFKRGIGVAGHSFTGIRADI